VVDAKREAASFRIRADLIEDLKRRARESSLSATALLERYLDEGLRHERHPLIVFRDGAGGRRPALIASRVDVAHVIDTLDATGAHGDDKIAEAAAYLGLSVTQIRAAVSYYAEYKDEVDAWRRHVRDLSEREHAAWTREQAVIA
jgi:uncharacterized protein (DUF433 family)